MKNFPQSYRDYIDGYMEGFEDLPDGAWFEVLGEACDSLMEQEDIDEDRHDMQMWYVSKEEEE